MSESKPPDDTAQTTIEPNKRRRRRGPSSTPDTPAATAEYLTEIFNGISWLVRSSARFSVAEFKGMAASFHALGKQLPQLALLLSILGPLTLAFQVLAKARRIQEGRPKREPEPEPAGMSDSPPAPASGVSPYDPRGEAEAEQLYEVRLG